MSDETFRPIKGEDIIFSFDGKEALHATSHTLTTGVDTKDVRTKQTEGKVKLPGDIDWSIDMDGMVILDTSITSPTVSSDGVFDMLRKKGYVDCVFRSPVDGVMKTYTGKVIFTKFIQTSPAGEIVTYQATATGSGNFKPITQPAE